MRSVSVLAVALFGVACTPPDDSGAIQAYAEVPELPENGLEFVSGDLEIPPMSEKMFCTFFTYDGPTIGVNTTISYQDPRYGHHSQLLETILTTSQAYDGEVMDCTSAEDFNMAQTETFYVPKPEGAGKAGMRLPEGFAVRLEGGQRLVLQSHYVNYEEVPILARDAVQIEKIDEAEVQTWAAAIAHTSLDLDIPPNRQSTQSIDCGFDADLNLLYLFGHMHQNGRAFSIDHTKVAGGTERIYEATPWLEGYRDMPPINDYELGEFAVSEGDSFRTTCTWLNEGEEALEFPNEMCVTVGIAYPSEERVYCAEF